MNNMRAHTRHWQPERTEQLRSLVLQNKSNKEIGQIMKVASNTISRHRQTLNLGRIDLYMNALRAGGFNDYFHTCKICGIAGTRAASATKAWLSMADLGWFMDKHEHTYCPTHRPKRVERFEPMIQPKPVVNRWRKAA